MSNARSDLTAIDYSEKPTAETRQDAPASPEGDAALASYIAEMSAELAKLAGRGGMPMLAYFLNLARVEAETRAREMGGYPIERSRA
jgi:hypothetical protein